MSNIPSLLEKQTGAVLASAIGDALGWPYESNSHNLDKDLLVGGNSFISWTRYAGGRYWGHRELIRAGEYSDDTQMILAVARSLNSKDWVEHLSWVELPYWLDYERGGGSALKRAARSYHNNHKPWLDKYSLDYFNAGGNGVVMRILPHVIAYANKSSINGLMCDIIRDGLITHGHPRALLGATCYAYTLHLLQDKRSILEYGELIDSVLNGVSTWGQLRLEAFPLDWSEAFSKVSPYNYSLVWKSTVDHMTKQLIYIKEALKKGLLTSDKVVFEKLKCFDKEKGAGDIAILAALYIASRYANNPTLGLKTAAYTIGLDTDTIASIAGGILGMLAGFDWIPADWISVQDYTYLCKIPHLLLSRQSCNNIDPNYCINQQFFDTKIGKVHIIETSESKCGKSGLVVISKLKTTWGQTLYVKQMKRNHEVSSSIPSENEGDWQEVSQTPNQNPSILQIDASAIKSFLNDPLLSRITFKKVLKIADMIIGSKYNNQDIAAAQKVSPQIVAVIRNWIVPNLE